jgi:cyclic pyranopterin phosphate synthase
MGGKGFTYFDKRGSAGMVDVSAKDLRSRRAVAKGNIAVRDETPGAVKKGPAEKDRKSGRFVRDGTGAPGRR